jgi:hypothetical protein
MYVDDTDRYTEYVLPNSEKLHLITQAELNNLVQDLNLSKNQVEFLASILQAWNLLEKTKSAPFLVTVKKKLFLFHEC